MEPSQFDVFLSHNGQDALMVERIAERLRREGLEPWLSTWNIPPGARWQEAIIEGLNAARSCAVLVGPHGLGDWAREELAVAQDRAAKDRTYRLFMVLLPGAPDLFDSSLAFLATRDWVDLRAGIDGSEGFQDLLSAITGIPHRPREPSVDGQGVSPYRGLEVFDEEHASFFFGRDDDIARVIEKLKNSRFLAVLGASGSGKSSLIRAGLIPALKRGALTGSEAWTVRVFVPGARPLSMLATVVGHLVEEESILDTLERLRADERTLDLAVSLALAERPPEERSVLIVDQFEEVFTLCADEDERRAFVANLCYAATIPGGRAIVILGLRADFYHRAAPYPELRALLATQQFLVGPLSPEGLRQAIEQPAWRAGLELEPGLAETILDDVADRPGVLPLLEHLLFEVWQRRHGQRLTLSAYVEAGGVEGALAKRANATYESLSPQQRAIARRVLLRLTQPGEGAEDTRRRARMEELVTRPGEEDDLEAVVKALADRRLLTVGSDQLSEQRVVDVAHESLIRGWPELAGWIDENRETLRAIRRLTEAAAEWDQTGHDESLLYRGAQLAAWAERDPEDLNERERAFLTASREREVRERAADRRRVRLALVGLSGVLVIIAVLAAVALVRGSREAAQKKTALSRELALSAGAQLTIDPELSLLLALEAVKAGPTDQADFALRRAIAQSRVRAAFRGHEGAVEDAVFSPDGSLAASAGDDGTVRIWDRDSGAEKGKLEGHEGFVAGVAFSPDGRMVVSAGEDGTVRIWDWAAGVEAAVLRGHDGAVLSVAFSPDGRMVVSAGEDGTVRIWDWAAGVEKAARSQESAVGSVAFSPDGRMVVSAGEDGTVRIWDWAAGAEAAVLRGHDGAVQSVAFSPDGHRVVSAGTDRTVRVRDWIAGTEKVLKGHEGFVFDAAFSPDGRMVVSAGEDGTVRIWDWAAGTEAAVLRGHDGAVQSVAFSPDGHRVVSAGRDATVRIWDWAAGVEKAALAQESAVESVAFSPDGRLVVSAGGGDATVRIWDWAAGTEKKPLEGHERSVESVAFSPDASLVVSAGEDSTVRIWDWAAGTEKNVLRGHQSFVERAAFSPDGRLVVSAGGGDATVRIWDWAAGAEKVKLTGHKGRVNSAAFSPDGRLVVSAGRDDATVRIWDWAAGTEKSVLRGHDGSVFDAAFSPDGRLVVSAGEDGTVRAWDRAAGTMTKVLGGHKGRVNSAAFSPDGRLVVSAGRDRTVRVWDWAAGTENVRFEGHESSVNDAAFSPDGRLVASAGDDRFVRVWSCETCGPIQEVLRLGRTRVTRRLSPGERRTFLHE